MKHKINKVLVLGSGALKIGEAGEFDYSGSQAIKAVKEEGVTTVLINPNIATIQTSKELADTVYFLPVEPSFVEKVILREKPDGVLLSFGGQTALNCGLKMARQGVFKHLGVQVLGTPISAIEKTEDRELFKNELAQLNLSVPKSVTVKSISEGEKLGKTIGFPLILRAGFSLGGLGSAVVYDEKELVKQLKLALAGSPQVLIEEYLAGWKEIEYEVVRDADDNCITVCNMENMDPMGIHTGESIVVAPSQTLTNDEYHFFRSIAIRVARAIGIIGECNIQFAVNPKNNEYRIIEVNARLSRSSALASKATGYPLAFIAAKLAFGYRLDELPNSVTRVTKAFFEPALDYIVVKIPRWDLSKFKLANTTIGTEMKSVGEVMAIGRTFEEAVQKAVRMLDQGHEGVIDENITNSNLVDDLQTASAKRIFFLLHALLSGFQPKEISRLTGIDSWFITRLQTISQTYREMKKIGKITPEILAKAKKKGFSDNQIAQIFRTNADAIRAMRKEHAIEPKVKAIDTLAGEFPAQTNYFYLTYHASDHDPTFLARTSQPSVVVLGSGPYRIGSSVEFDWCAVNAVIELKRHSIRTIMINCNPETVSTDYDYSDVLYFEELTGERVLDIWELERPQKIVLSVGGQIPNNLAPFCQKHQMTLLGSDAQSIGKAEDRHKFSQLLEHLSINQPPWKELTNKKDVVDFARTVGYPVLVRPSFVLSGTAMSVLYSDEDVSLYLKNRKIARKSKFVVSKFVVGAREIDYDAVAARGEIAVRAISEHVELAGIHSGDATLVLPPYRIGNETIGELDRISKKIAKALKITGPFNIQFLERMGHIMVIECNLRASRSFPFVSKVLNTNFMQIAINYMVDEKKEVHFEPISINHVGVKAAQFSFNRIKGADPVLHVEMSSTGEVATMATNLHDAYLKSLLSVGMRLPKKTIVLSIGGWENKEAFFPYAKILAEMNFVIYATEKTHDFLQKRGIHAKKVSKLYLNEKGETTIVDLLKEKKIDLVINVTETPLGGLKDEKKFQRKLTDGYFIRRTAVDFHIPLLTNLEAAMLFVRSLSEKQHYELEILPWNAYIENNYSFYPQGGNMVKPIEGSFAGKHIVSVDQFDEKDLGIVLALAKKLKKEIHAGKVRHDLAGKIMAAIFYEPSSRTFGSFVASMARLGGGVIPLQGVVYSSVAKGELLPDTIRTFGSFADVIVLRHPEEGSAKIAASYSQVPVINAGDGIGEHPTQALLDLFTIGENFKSIDGLSIGMVGDLLNGRTIHSLSKLLGHYKNITIYLVAPDVLQVSPELEKTLKAKGLKIVKMDSLGDVIGRVDVLYMTRVQKERFADLGEYERVKNYYILTPEIMKKAKKHMIVMHPFPRVGEISYDVDSDPRAVYIRNQMQNGMYVRMALLLLILGKKR